MDGYITIGTELETKEFDKQIAELEKQLEQMEKDYKNGLKGGLTVDSAPMRKLAVETEKARNKLVGLYQQKMKLQNSGGFDIMNKSLGEAIKKAGKLVLGIFGIRSAYLAIRRYSSDLAGYDPQYAANLEYIRWVLTQAIAPVLRGIVTLVGTILQYIYAILNAWFGIGAKLDLSAESFRKMKNNAGGVSKAVKQIKKDLLGFDEINRLTDQSDTGTSAGATGVGIPDFEIGGLGNIPDWLKWIMDNKQTILSVLGAIAGIFAGIKIVSFLQNLRGVFTVFRNISALKLAGMFAGIAIAITGLVQTIQAVIKFIGDPTWENFTDILHGIETALIGVGIAMVALNASNPVGWIILAIGAVGKLIELFSEDRAQILDLEEAQRQLSDAIKETHKATDRYISAIENAEEAEKKLAEAERKHRISGEELQLQVENGTLKYQDMTEAQREVYKAYRNNIAAQDELNSSTENLTQKKHDEMLASLETQLTNADEAKSYDELKKQVIDAYDKNIIKAEEARDILERATHDMSLDAYQTFQEDIPTAIKEGFDPTRYSSVFHKLQMATDSLFTIIKNNLKKLFNINASVNVSGSSGGGRAKGGIFYPSKMPKLAVGGIINMPGRGMPYNGAIIGERGAEAVVPLTDTQQMELLGATIGKYITVNANIVNTMNGRIISRELKQIQSEQDFAYNM